MQAIVLVAAISGFLSFVRRVVRLRRAMEPGRTRKGLSSPGNKILAGHWTSAASGDSYTETSALLVNGQVLAFILAGVTTVVVTAAQWQNAILRHAGQPLLGDVLDACCSEELEGWDPSYCSSFCRLGRAGLSTLLTASCGLFITMMASVVFVPTKLWSPINFLAADKTGDANMKRLLFLPIPTTIFLVVNMMSFALHALNMIMSEQLNAPTLWQAVFCFELLVLAAEILTIVWATPWRHLLGIPAAVLRDLRANANNRVAPYSDGHVASRGSLWRCRESASYPHMVILYCAMYCFGVEVLDTNGMSTVELWVVRAVILLLVFLPHDEPVGFEALDTKGAGFGLVVNANQLRHAILAHLDDKKYRGTVKRYKASLLRMTDTMAVSYRWSQHVVTLGGGLQINMTRWQLEELVLGIERSRCLYVWIDSCSVPQEIPRLKEVLLSRMMAVYGSAFVTLALLSREKETERYHQVRGQARGGGQTGRLQV